MSGSRARQPNKASLTMRNELERRGIDIIDLQMEVYRKAMSKVDAIAQEQEHNQYLRDAKKNTETNGEEYRGEEPNTYLESAVGYLSICNQAVATLAKYSYPTMAAVQVQNMDKEVNEKVIDALEVRKTILGDPFAAQVAHKATSNTDTGLPVLIGGKKDE